MIVVSRHDSGGPRGIAGPGTTSTPRRTGGELRRTIVITTVLALIAGVAFPAVILVAGQLAFPAQAAGSLLRDANGQVIGSTLIGQAFTDPAYFHGRPSAAGADGYDGSASSGLNLGVVFAGRFTATSGPLPCESKALRDPRLRERVA